MRVLALRQVEHHKNSSEESATQLEAEARRVTLLEEQLAKEKSAYIDLKKEAGTTLKFLQKERKLTDRANKASLKLEALGNRETAVKTKETQLREREAAVAERESASDFAKRQAAWNAKEKDVASRLEEAEQRLAAAEKRAAAVARNRHLALSDAGAAERLLSAGGDCEG